MLSYLSCHCAKLSPLVLSLRKAAPCGLVTAQSCPMWSCHCAKLPRVVMSLRKAVSFGLVTAQSCPVWSCLCAKQAAPSGLVICKL